MFNNRFSEEKLNSFVDIYQKHLTKAVNDNPKDYAYDVSFVPTVVERMTKAIVNQTFNKDSIAIKRTCKELDIPFTYKAIYSFLEVQPK